MLENIEDLSLIMTMEQGKPLAEASGEIRYGAGFIKWFAEEARRIYGDTVPAPSPDRRVLVLREPSGFGGDHAVEFPERSSRRARSNA
jgi:succinate-semialdehyde dehydrogenase/glutarate-semialdehyde dehydrogenase